MDNRKDFLEALKDDTAYDYIANHYMEYTQTELKDIVLELLYGIHTEENRGNITNSTRSGIAEELADRWSIDE